MQPQLSMLLNLSSFFDERNYTIELKTLPPLISDEGICTLSQAPFLKSGRRQHFIFSVCLSMKKNKIFDHATCRSPNLTVLAVCVGSVTLCIG